MPKKASYDPSLDRMLTDVGTWVGGNKTSLQVSLQSYNGGPLKFNFRRTIPNRYSGGTSFTAMGRLTLEEAEGLLPIFTKAVEEARRIEAEGSAHAPATVEEPAEG